MPTLCSKLLRNWHSKKRSVKFLPTQMSSHISPSHHVRTYFSQNVRSKWKVTSIQHNCTLCTNSSRNGKSTPTSTRYLPSVLASLQYVIVFRQHKIERYILSRMQYIHVIQFYFILLWQMFIPISNILNIYSLFLKLHLHYTSVPGEL